MTRNINLMTSIFPSSLLMCVVRTHVKNIKGSFVWLSAQIRSPRFQDAQHYLNELQFEEGLIHGEEVGQGYPDEI